MLLSWQKSFLPFNLYSWGVDVSHVSKKALPTDSIVPLSGVCQYHVMIGTHWCGEAAQVEKHSMAKSQKQYISNSSVIFNNTWSVIVLMFPCNSVFVVIFY